jgi:hypothetical protein
MTCITISVRVSDEHSAAQGQITWKVGSWCSSWVSDSFIRLTRLKDLGGERSLVDKHQNGLVARLLTLDRTDLSRV